ncbi:MAG: hypothetical protein QM757_26435 [Paludibaculum sp.]
MAGFATPLPGGDAPVEAAPTEFLADLDSTLDAPASAAVDDPGPVDDGPQDVPLETDTPPIEEPAGDEPPIEEEPTDDSQESTDSSQESTQPTEPAAAVADPNLPEGVRAYERHGKQFMSVPKEVWDRTFGGFQGMQALEEVIGEPLTKEALHERQTSHNIRILMREDYVSGDPDAQANFIMRFLGHEAQEAMKNGEVGVDPLLTFVDTLPQVLEAQYPEAYKRMESNALRSSLDTLYLAAGRLGLDGKDGQNLLYSVQRVDKTRFGSYRSADDVKALVARTPEQPAADEVGVLRAKLADRDARDAQTAYRSWSTETNRGIGTSIDGVIGERLNNPDLVKAYEAKDLADVREKLHTHVSEALKANAQWNSQMQLNLRQAQRAVSPERRDAVRQVMVQQATNIARRAVEAKLPQLLAERTKRAVAANQQRHERRAAGAQHRAPGKPGAPGTTVSSNLPATRVAFANDAEFEAELNKALA